MMFPMNDCFSCSQSTGNEAEMIKMRRDSDPGYSSNNGSNLSSPDLMLVVNSDEKLSLSSLEYVSKLDLEKRFGNSAEVSESERHRHSSNNHANNKEVAQTDKHGDHCPSEIHDLLDDSSSIGFYENSSTFADTLRRNDREKISVSTSMSQSHKVQKSHQIGLDFSKGASKLDVNRSRTHLSDFVSRDWKEAHDVKYDDVIDDDLDFLGNLTSNHKISNSDLEINQDDHFSSNLILNRTDSNELKFLNRTDSNELKSNFYFDDFGGIDSSVLSFFPETYKTSTERDSNEIFREYNSGSSSSTQNSPENLCSKDREIDVVSPLTCLNEHSDLKDFSPASLNDHGRTRTPNVINPNIGEPIDPLHTTEDEAWRSYLENPLTAATTAMMSIHGDEDSAAALGLLYDYYKVPREKRILSYQVDNSASSVRALSSTHHPGTLETVTFADDAIVLANGSVQRSRGHSGSSSTDQDSALHDVISLGSDCTSTFSLGRPSDLPLSSETGDFLNIERTNSDNKRNQLTPDSAFSESKEASPQVHSFNDCTNTYLVQRNRSKHKRGPFLSTCVHSVEEEQQTLHLPLHSHQTSLSTSTINLPNLFTTGDDVYSRNFSREMFEYVMEAPKSLKQKEGEPTMSYINKGQFYCVSLRDCLSRHSSLTNGRITSVVQVVFGDVKSEDEQQRLWRYWHARQHTAKQRIIDIADYKESCMISDIDEFAHNAIAFNWDPSDVAKIFISCNCLSTDFSAQKGIKGLPLLLQIDTYLNNRRGGVPDHRAACQLKVFCDKGAERKIRDEERKAARKKQKNGVKGSHQMPLSPVDVKPVVHSPNSSSPPPQSLGQNNPIPRKLDNVYFTTFTDRRPAIYFVPEMCGASRTNSSVSPITRIQTDNNFINGSLTPTSSTDVEQTFLSNSVDCFDTLRSPSKRSHSLMSSEDGEFPSAKLPKVWDTDSSKKVLLYIRKESEEVFDAVMLKEPTLDGLKDAIQEKYSIQSDKISKLLKKSKKGILVNMDDNIVRHYSNEDTFVIDVTSYKLEDDVTYKVTLSVV